MQKYRMSKFQNGLQIERTRLPKGTGKIKVLHICTVRSKHIAFSILMALSDEELN